MVAMRVLPRPGTEVKVVILPARSVMLKLPAPAVYVTVRPAGSVMRLGSPRLPVRVVTRPWLSVKGAGLKAVAEDHLVAIPVLVADQAATARAKAVDLARSMEGERKGAALHQGGIEARDIVVAAVAVLGEGRGEAAGAGVVDRAIAIDD